MFNSGVPWAVHRLALVGGFLLPVAAVVASVASSGCGVSPPVPDLASDPATSLHTYALTAAQGIAGPGTVSAAAIAAQIEGTEASLMDEAKARAESDAVNLATGCESGCEPSTEFNLLPSQGMTVNQVDTLIDPEAYFTAILAAIKSAQHRIQADLFMLGGNIGSEVAAALVERQQAGVQVQVLLDPHFAEMGPAHDQSEATATFLREHQIPVRTFPLATLAQPDGYLAKATLIDHDKLLVIDDTAYIGCANLIQVADTNHDLFFKVRGPVAAETGHLLDQEWGFSLPAPWATTQDISPAAAGDSAAGVSGGGLARLTRTDREEHSTRDRLLVRINTANSIDIAVFETDDPDFKAALINAHNRGAAVRVLLDRHQMDAKYTGKHLVGGIPNVLAVRDLLDAGIKVSWFDNSRPLQEMHLKMALFDHQAAIVGSTNFTTKAFLNFRETGLELEGGKAVADLQRMFEDDWAHHSTAVNELSVDQRVLAAAIAFMDRHQLGWW